MAQILAVIIFVAMFALIVTEKIERHIVTLYVVFWCWFLYLD